MHFVGSIRDHSKRFDSDKHAQLTADAYDTFVMMVTYDLSNVIIRARLPKRLGQQSPQLGRYVWCLDAAVAQSIGTA